MPRFFHTLQRPRCMTFVGALLLTIGCQTADYVAPPPLPVDALPFTLDLEQHRVRMSTVAPYDTVTLSATVRTVSGDVLPDAVITFASTDSAVRVTTDGKLTARGVRDGAVVLVSGVTQGIRFVDTAFVYITDETNPPRIASFRLQTPFAPTNIFAAQDSLNQLEMRVTALDIHGDTIPNIVPYFSASRTTAAILGFGYLTPMKPGNVTVYASTTYYGTTYRDSTRYTIVAPLYASMYLNARIRASDGSRILSFSPDTVVISAGGWVAWFNEVPDVRLDITFNDPGAATPGCHSLFGCGGELPETGGTGNIAAFTPDSTVIFGNTRFRRFLRPGTYTFRTSVSAATGAILVR